MTPEEKLRQFRARRPEGDSALDRMFDKGRAVGSAVAGVARRADAGRGSNPMILSPGERTNPNPVRDYNRSATQTAATSARTGNTPRIVRDESLGKNVADVMRMNIFDGQKLETQREMAARDGRIDVIPATKDMKRLTPEAPVRSQSNLTFGFQDEYAGADVSGLSKGEFARFRIDTANRAADAFAENRRRFAPRPQGGSDTVMRNRLLGEYKEKMNQVLEDSRTRKLTARGTANAIDALNGYYSQALGLSPQQEEAGRNYRAELATQETTTPETPQKRYSVTTDDYGNTAVFDAITGKLDYTKSARFKELYAEYQKALGDPMKAERARSLLLQLQSLGYDPEAE